MPLMLQNMGFLCRDSCIREMKDMMNLKDMLRPVWEVGQIFRETFACVEEGGFCSAPFLLEPEKLIRIESYDQTQRYEAGRDCYVENGRLCLTGNSRIPHTGWETFYYSSRKEAEQGKEEGAVKLDFGPVAVSDGRFLTLNAIGNPDFATRWQVAVTYEAKEGWEGFRPVSRIARLPRLYGKLKRKEKVRIVLYGDSISCGCDSSGLYGLKPEQPIWPELLMESLRDFYKTDIEFINTSVGGKDTQWAIENAVERAASYKPDLVILGFGMNDRCGGAQYREKTKCLIDTIRREAPEAEFVLIATTLPNPLTDTEPMHFCAHQGEYARSLRLLCRQGIVLADVQDVQRTIMKRKRYIDLTGNLLNHPNDYLSRIQAQVLDTVLKPRLPQSM